MSDLRGELLAIRARHGVLTPRIVVDEAAADDHPLHASFNWDDASAADAHRIGQASALIRSVRIQFRRDNGDLDNVREWYNVRRETGRVYEPVAEITKDPLSAKIVARDMERQWRELKRRWETFDEFRQMVLRDLGAA